MQRIVLFARTGLRHRRLTDYGNWVVLTLAMTTLGLGSLAYDVSDRFFSAQLVEKAPWRLMLTIDGICIALAVLLGPWQFVPGLRWRWPQVHGWLGRLYAGSAMTCALVTILLAWQVDAGLFARMILMAFGSAWLVTTGMMQVRRGDIGVHRRWMVRSFALTATTVCLRFCFVLGLPFAAVPLVVACLGWLPALVAVEIWLCEAEELKAHFGNGRGVPPASRTRNLRVEISVGPLDLPVSAWAADPRSHHGEPLAPPFPEFKARIEPIDKTGRGEAAVDALPPHRLCRDGGAGRYNAFLGLAELRQSPSSSFTSRGVVAGSSPR
ncbi:DUF2306 domain-containing protein [Pseudoroseomonas wenyumeiae]